MLKFLVILLFFISTNYAKLVEISNGVLQGEFVDNLYYSFKGIPYAEPPVGNLRFEISKPYTKTWDGIRNFTNFSDVCLQWNQFKQSNNDYLIGSEDCLYLNIFTKSLNSSQKFPVFVYLHGGAFMYGSGDFFGPRNLFKFIDFVFVSINYRLGPLGFLSTQDDIVPGNMGLKDQVLALKWIKKNILNFGGDPDNIILIGLSAGGASVHLHTLSNLSKDLFKKGISHSGSALNPWVLRNNLLEQTKKLSKSLNCSIQSNNLMIECLKTIPSDKLVRNVQFLQNWLYNPFNPFGVAIEEPNENSFLTEHPLNLLKSGNYSINKPIIFIMALGEGLYPGAQFIVDDYLNDLNNNWNEYLPNVLHFNNDMEYDMKNSITNEIRNYYLNNKTELTMENFNELCDIISDYLFKCGIEEASHLQSNKTNSYLIYYKSDVATTSIANILSLSNIKFSAGHGDDHIILFDNEMHPNELNNDELKMVKKFALMFEEFSTSTGIESHPSFGKIQLIPIQSNSNNIPYLNIKDNENISIEYFNDKPHCYLWKNLQL